MNREQKLVDICYQLVLTATDPAFVGYFSQMSHEEKAAWVTRQIADCGFKTSPCGSSWGVLHD